MNSKDLLTLSYLRQNGRVSLTSLARKTSVPHSTLFDKVRSGKLPFSRYTVLLDFERLGFNTRAHILFAVEKQDKEGLIASLKKSPNVNSLFRVNNGWDVIMECIFMDMRALESFVEQLESKFRIKDKQVHYIIDEFKRESFLSDPQLVKFVIDERA